ncbi:hypothetical protein OC835_007402 [Tilletia horrida]|nr:hypothetical protein OC835_007402 [Tilletia horrida]
MTPLQQRFRLAANSVLGMTQGSASFRSRLGFSSSSANSSGASSSGPAAASASSARGSGDAQDDGTADEPHGAGERDDQEGKQAASNLTTEAADKKPSTSTASKRAAIPLGAAYPGAPDDLMERLGWSANKDKNKDVYPTLFDPDTLHRTGLLEIKPHKNSLHRDPFRIWWEEHGSGGPIKLLFVMGLQSSCFSWLDSVVHYSKDPRYSCVVLDNRGFANSDAPYGRYRTSCMAWDCLLLLDELGWTAQRSVHVVGVSMGGMITLELAKIAPERFASIMLVSTTSGQGGGEKSLLTSLPPARGVATMGKLMGGGGFAMGEKAKARAVVEMLFPQRYLAEKHKSDPEGRTNREVLTDVIQWRASFSRVAPFHGSASQIGAVLTHRVSNKELAKINEDIPVITIMTGDEDNLVNPLNSEHLAENMPRARLIKLENAGHAITIQRPEAIHDALDEDILLAQERIKNEGDVWIKTPEALQEAEEEREEEAKRQKEEADQVAEEARLEEQFGATEEELDLLSRADAVVAGLVDGMAPDQQTDKA